MNLRIPRSLTLVDSFGNAIPPRNFHKLSHFKRGYTLRDVALTIHTGNNGTPMPAFNRAFPSEEIWDIAFYAGLKAMIDFPPGASKAPRAKSC